jgi:hypothetical protein
MPDLTHNGLKKAVAAIARNGARDAEAIRGHAKNIDDEATDTGRVAEMIGTIRVDPSTVAETRELAKIMAGVSEASLAYAAAADTTARSAHAAHTQASASHDGIQEAASRSSAGRDVYDVHRDWLTQQ